MQQFLIRPSTVLLEPTVVKWLQTTAVSMA
jgi:hypothetical protein